MTSAADRAPVRVLVAEDSPTARTLLVAMLESDPGIRVVGQARDGVEAVRMTAELRPDLVTMDVHMPGGDGLAATREIMARIPTPIIIVSALAAADVAISLEATRAGALMVLPKPEGPASTKFPAQRDQLVSMVHAMAQVKVVRRWRPADRQATGERTGPKRPGSPGGTPIRLVAIAASTGGPAALRDLLADLPGDFPVPILLVQHIARGFVAGLASWLGSETPLRVRIAVDGETAVAGSVYIAPDDRHLGVSRGSGDAISLALSDAPQIGVFRPSASHLFESAGRLLGPRLVAVILTGMGEDGVAGLRTAHAAGAHVLAQDEASSVIYGMPREAARAGVVHAVLPLDAMAVRLRELVAR